jgi:DNA replication and repair protein RecF
VRAGADVAIVRCEANRDGRRLLIEAEVHPNGRDRVLVNRQPLRRTRDLLGAIQVTVFAPDDLALIKGGPQGRRDYLDDLLVALHPRHDVLRGDLDHILRQRNALLKQAGGNPRPPADIVTTLDVWDQKLAETGTAVAAARAGLVGSLGPELAAVYDRVAERVAHVTVDYRRSWSGGLATALAAARPDDLRRGVTTLGPQRDDLVVTLGGLPSRTHASQGEQRSLALSLRLAGHLLVTRELGGPPLLLLDDVFSELDADRSAALLESLPPGQAFVTTAGRLPSQAHPELVVRVEGGKILP